VNCKRVDEALVWQRNHETVRIEPWGTDSLRVRATVGAEIRDDLVGALLPAPALGAIVEITADSATIRNGAIMAEVGSDGCLRFIDVATNTELLAEKRPVPATRIPPRHFRGLPGDLFHLEARFLAYLGERMYGLGQHQHGLLDQKGAIVELIQRNTEVSIPFLFSSRKYGFLWNNPAVGRVELGTNETRWVAEATPQLDYWVTTGASPAEIMEHYAEATGHAPEFPEWAAGFWQCKLRYRTQEELLSVAREHTRRGLPLSVIVSDFFHWTLQGDWKFDPELWPDPAAMVRELDDMGVKLMVSIWPSVNALSENFEAMQTRGLLLRTERGIPVLHMFRDNRPEGPAYTYYYDATNPEAREFLWQQIREHYYAIGIKVFWLDACEPEMHPMDVDNVRFHAGSGLAVANVYPRSHEQGVFEGLLGAGEKTALTLCRSAWAGSQRFGAALWSGDISSTFEALQVQVRAGMNVGLSGIPWWTTDIGGFYGGDPGSPAFRELLVRWFQYGVFCPLFRLHGYRSLEIDADTMLFSGGANEVWSFGDEAYAIIKPLLFLRERLRPYVMQHMKRAEESGIPPMRPLFFDFPDDEGCVQIDDQFLFGSDILVAPILHAGERRRNVYLPSGATWTDAWSGETLTGGRYITAEAPLERIPVYLRDGAQKSIFQT
jgi:alpha-D-xyloside xylohydrolase